MRKNLRQKNIKNFDGAHCSQGHVYQVYLIGRLKLIYTKTIFLSRDFIININASRSRSHKFTAYSIFEFYLIFENISLQ